MKFGAVCAVLALMISLSACQGQPPDNGLISLPPSAEPAIEVSQNPVKYNAFGLAYSSNASLNPLTGSNRLNAELAPLMYQGLFELDGDGGVVPVLCSRFFHQDLQWTFTIKRGVTFGDGESLTAKDVAYSLNAAKTTERYKARFSDLATIAVQDEYTVVVTTFRPLGHLELLLDIPIIKDGTIDEKVPPGSGAFAFSDEGDACLRLKPDRRNGANITLIQLVDLPEVELLVSGFEMGSISAVSADATATDPIVYGGDYEEWMYPTTNLVYLGFNTTREVLAGADMRRALSSAIDRNEICRTDMLVRGEPFSFADGGMTAEQRTEVYANLGLDDQDDDGVLDYAAGRLRFPLDLKLLVCSDNAFKLAAANRIADNLRDDGVGVTVSAVSWDAYNVALKNGGYDLYLGEVKLTADRALDTLIGSGATLNHGGYSSAVVDELLDAFAATDADGLEGARQDLYKELDIDAPIAPLMFKMRSLLARRGVAGAPQPTQSNVYNNVEMW